MEAGPQQAGIVHQLLGHESREPRGEKGIDAPYGGVSN